MNNFKLCVLSLLLYMEKDRRGWGGGVIQLMKNSFICFVSCSTNRLTLKLVVFDVADRESPPKPSWVKV